MAEFHPAEKSDVERLFAQRAAVWEENFDPDNIPRGVDWVVRKNEKGEYEVRRLRFSTRCWGF